MGPKWRISADEINCLIYAYLQDSGFQHSSYALRNEARLDLSQHADAPIRRGELVDLLSKALLYTEVETHWNLDATLTCDSPFSLLYPHRCISDPTNRQTSQPPSPYRTARRELFPYTNGTTYSSTQTSQKRKASSDPTEDSRAEKRICAPEDRDMHLVLILESDIEMATEDKKLKLTTNDIAGVTTDVAEKMEGNSSVPNQVETFPAAPALQIEEPFRSVVLLLGHEDEVFVSAWNPVYADLLATGSNDATTRIWSCQNVESTLAKGVNSLYNANPHLQILHPDPIILSHSGNFGQAGITSLDWSPDGNLLASGSFDSTLRVWSRNGEIYMIQTRHSSPIVTVRFSPDGKYLLSAGLDGLVCAWNTLSRILHIEFHIESRCLDVDWLDDSTFATCSTNQNIHMVSVYPDDAFRNTVRLDQTLGIFTGHTGDINQIRFNKDKSLLASCSDDTTARIWTREAWTNADGCITTAPGSNMMYEAKLVLLGHTSSIGAVRWCPSAGRDVDSQTILATCSDDKTARLWDAKDGSCLHILDSSSQSLYSLTFNPTGQYLATGSEDGYLYIYDTATGKNIRRWPISGPGVGPIYDVNWEQSHGLHLALCLRSKLVAIVDTKKLLYLPGG